MRGYLQRLRANWPALLLPLIMAGALAVIHGLTSLGPGEIRGVWPVLLIAAAGSLAFLAPEKSARIAPFAVFAFGAWGFYLVHSLSTSLVSAQLNYGLVHVSVFSHLIRQIPGAPGPRWAVGFTGSVSQVGPDAWQAWRSNGRLGLVLAEAVAFLAAGVWLLAWTGAPGGGAVRRAAAQLRGTDGQPRTVPPLLLLPVIFLWEEMFGQHLWFGRQGGAGFAVLAARDSGTDLCRRRGLGRVGAAHRRHHGGDRDPGRRALRAAPGTPADGRSGGAVLWCGATRWRDHLVVRRHPGGRARRQPAARWRPAC